MPLTTLHLLLITTFRVLRRHRASIVAQSFLQRSRDSYFQLFFLLCYGLALWKRVFLSASCFCIELFRALCKVGANPFENDRYWVEYDGKLYLLTPLAFRHRGSRSSSLSSLIVCRTQLSTVGDRAFPVAATRMWNTLPPIVTPTSSLTVLGKRLKTEFFSHSVLKSPVLPALWLCISETIIDHCSYWLIYLHLVTSTLFQPFGPPFILHGKLLCLIVRSISLNVLFLLYVLGHLNFLQYPAITIPDIPPRRTETPYRSPGTFMGLPQPEQEERGICPLSTSICLFEPDSRTVTAYESRPRGFYENGWTGEGSRVVSRDIPKLDSHSTVAQAAIAWSPLKYIQLASFCRLSFLLSWPLPSYQCIC